MRWEEWQRDLDRYRKYVSRDLETRAPTVFHVIITEWPSGTTSIKFGSALFSSLYVKQDHFELIRMSPERIFRVEGAATEDEFRETLSKYRRLGVSCPGQIHFIEGEMNLLPEGTKS